MDHLARLGAPAAVGLDEISFLAATTRRPSLLVTGIVDLDAGRLVDVLPARSAVAVTDWPTAKPAPWLAGIRHVVIDPYQPYATAVAKGLPTARLVVDHFPRDPRTPRGAMSAGAGERPAPPGCRSSPVKLRAARPWRCRGGREAALTTTGRISTARWCGPG